MGNPPMGKYPGSHYEEVVVRSIREVGHGIMLRDPDHAISGIVGVIKGGCPVGTVRFIPPPIRRTG